MAGYNVTSKLFADDAKLYAEISTDVGVADINSTLSCISQWVNTMVAADFYCKMLNAIHLNTKCLCKSSKQLAKRKLFISLPQC